MRLFLCLKTDLPSVKRRWPHPPLPLWLFRSAAGGGNPESRPLPNGESKNTQFFARTIHTNMNIYFDILPTYLHFFLNSLIFIN